MQLQASFSFLLILTFCQELHYASRKVLKSPFPALCKLPLDKGECRAAFRRRFYNFEAGKCELFRYGGCKGNTNNFLSKVKCEKVCKVT
uniref:Serine peptidase inhibitor, Kunitz type, 3 n=1 Tax=Nannospalax galili TaxID=1026970 RepID=A0A8C6S0J8_NANGA